MGLAWDCSDAHHRAAALTNRGPWFRKPRTGSFESLLHRHIRNDKTPENVKVFRGFVFSEGRKKPVWEHPWEYGLLFCPRSAFGHEVSGELVAVDIQSEVAFNHDARPANGCPHWLESTLPKLLSTSALSSGSYHQQKSIRTTIWCSAEHFAGQHRSRC